PGRALSRRALGISEVERGNHADLLEEFEVVELVPVFYELEARPLPGPLRWLLASRACRAAGPPCGVPAVTMISSFGAGWLAWGQAAARLRERASRNRYD